jgi:shikimate kinase
MHIALVGMSGIGKSYWSQQLQNVGFKRYCCDEIIAQKLSGEIGQPIKTVEDLGEWMGLPYESNYEAHAAQYFSLEIITLQEIIGTFESGKNLPETKVVIDTTGSAIYAPAAIWQQLRAFVKVIHLATAPEIRLAKVRDYLQNPRPVLWNGFFQPQPGETLNDTFIRCYPALLEQREKLYEQYSDLRIEYQVHQQPNLTIERFLQICQSL